MHRAAILRCRSTLETGADFFFFLVPIFFVHFLLKTTAVSQASNIPIAAYHVSGEYAMIKAAAEKVSSCERTLQSLAPNSELSDQGWVNEKDIVMEVMTGFKRAGRTDSTICCKHFMKF